MSKSYKFVTREDTLQNAVANAFSELQESLAQEMREWHDSMPESLKNGDKAAAIEEVADTLEGLDVVELDDLPEALLNCKISWPEAVKVKGRSKTPSRSARRDTATVMLSAAIENLRGWADEQETQLEQAAAGDAVEEEEGKELEEQINTAREKADAIKEQKDDADGVEFPGMFG